MTKSISLAAAVAAALTSGVAMAELTGNAAITNNYIWRGVTQTNDQAAGQGGLDYSFGPGFYVGTWLSNVDFSGLGDGTEVDLYAGWGGETGGFGYDPLYPTNLIRPIGCWRGYRSSAVSWLTQVPSLRLLGDACAVVDLIVASSSSQITRNPTLNTTWSGG